jgi:hypothetical protein
MFSAGGEQSTLFKNRGYKYLKAEGLLVEQRGIEPLASALRTRLCSFY